MLSFFLTLVCELDQVLLGERTVTHVGLPFVGQTSPPLGSPTGAVELVNVIIIFIISITDRVPQL